MDKDKALVERAVQTNGERIRRMSDEEMAAYFAETFCHGYGQPQLLMWLQQPAPEEREQG